MVWPKGKRRHADGTDRQEIHYLMARLSEYLESNRQAGMTLRKCAKHLGCSVRTLRRWMAGEDWPPPEAVERLRAMCGGAATIHREKGLSPWERSAAKAAEAAAARRLAALKADADGRTAAEAADRRYHGNGDADG